MRRNVGGAGPRIRSDPVMEPDATCLCPSPSPSPRGGEVIKFETLLDRIFVGIRTVPFPLSPPSPGRGGGGHLTLQGAPGKGHRIRHLR